MYKKILVLFVIIISIFSISVFANEGLSDKSLFITNSYFTTGITKTSNNFILPKTNNNIGNHFKGGVILVLNTFLRNGKHKLYVELYDKTNNLIDTDKLSKTIEIDNKKEFTSSDFIFRFNISSFSDYYYIKLYNKYNNEKKLVNEYIIGGIE